MLKVLRLFFVTSVWKILIYPLAYATCLIILLYFSKVFRDIGIVSSLCAIELYAANLSVLG